MITFQHTDGRIMVAEEAGGTGGGATSVHHRLATAIEAEAWNTLHPDEVEVPSEEPVAEVAPHTDPAPPVEPSASIESEPPSAG